MILGRVNENYEIVIPVILPDLIDRELHEFEAVVDTGLDYYLALPRETIERMGFPINGTLNLTIDDIDLNSDPLVLDTVVVGVENAGTGESEAVTLTETGVDTGVF